MGGCGSAARHGKKQLFRLVQMLKFVNGGDGEEEEEEEEGEKGEGRGGGGRRGMRRMDGIGQDHHREEAEREEEEEERATTMKRRRRRRWREEEGEVPKMVLTEEIVAEYLKLEREIRKLEGREVIGKSEKKIQEAEEWMKQLAQLEATQKELKKQTEKERADLEGVERPSVKALLRREGTYEERRERGKQKYDTAMAREEMAEKELKMAKKQFEKAQRAANLYRERAEGMERKQQRQEEIVGAIFGAEYADPKHDELEAAIEWGQRVQMAKFKWTNGRVLLVHASIQISFGIARWKELLHMDWTNARMRYFTAAEARNNFNAAGQNIQSCRVYLGRVKMPYAGEEEMQAMENAVQNAFNDVQSNAMLKRALTICQGVHKNVHSLIQWFDKVINETILRDLDRANGNVVKEQRQMRELRLEMMRKGAREKLGREWEEEVVEEGEGQEEMVEEDDEEEEREEEEDDDELVKTEDIGGGGGEGDGDHQLAEGEPPMNEDEKKRISPLPNGPSPPPPVEQLAPIPPKDVLFGDIQEKLSEFGQLRAMLRRRNEAWREWQRRALWEQLRVRQEEKKRRMGKFSASTTILPSFPSLVESTETEVMATSSSAEKP